MKTRVLTILVVCCLALSPAVQSGSSIDYARYAPHDKMAPFGMAYASTVGLFQMVNYSGDGRAVAVCQPLIEEWLVNYGLLVRSPEELRPIRRQYRIRSAGQVSRIDAERLRDRLRLDYLVIGSVDIFRGDSLAEIALSVRVLDLETMSLVRAASIATTSRDYGGLFGIGRLNTVEELADRAIERLFKALDEPVRRDAKTPQHRIALVPIDNLSEYRRAGEIMSNHLLSHLVSRGHWVLEPGMAYGLFVENRVMPAGEITLSTLRAVRNEFEIAYLVTGSVELYEEGVLSIETAQPRLSMTGRILDAPSGRIIGADMVATDGDGEALLDIGKEDSLGRLSITAARQMMKKLFKQQEQRVAAKK